MEHLNSAHHPEVVAVIADVDGTILTSDKRLTDRAIAAVGRLREGGIPLMITSGRPPRGMAMLVEPLDLSTPMAAFNGATFVNPDLSILERHRIPDALVEPVCEILSRHGLDIWVYTDRDWFVRDPTAPHVDREAFTVGYSPTVRSHLEATVGVVKVVGVLDDEEKLDSAATSIGEAFGGEVTGARSQPYYLDITSPEANKGNVVSFFASRFGIDRGSIATIGDMPNDVSMFEAGGLAIAMGNAEASVQERADVVTSSNDDDGFAAAIDRFVLVRSAEPSLEVSR